MDIHVHIPLKSYSIIQAYILYYHKTHFQHQMAGQNQQQGDVAKCGKEAICQTAPDKEAGLDWTGSLYNQYHMPDFNLEPTGRRKEGNAQTQLSARHGSSWLEAGRTTQSEA